jgi:hypothetical protein
LKQIAKCEARTKFSAFCEKKSDVIVKKYREKKALDNVKYWLLLEFTQFCGWLPQSGTGLVSSKKRMQ